MTNRSTVAALAIATLVTTADADIRVTNEAGEPLPNASVLVLMQGQYGQHQALTADEDGVASTKNLNAINNAATKVKIIANAPGHAWGTLDLGEMEDPSTADATIAIPKGREVTVALKAPEDRPLPAGTVPFVFDHQSMGPVWWNYNGFGTLSNVNALGEGRFTFQVPEELDEPIHLGLNDEDYLVGWFSTEPVDTNAEVATFELPQPGSALVKFDVPEGVDAGEVTVSVGASVFLPGGSGGIGFQLDSETMEKARSFEKQVDNLAPGGSYSAEFFAGSPHTRWNIDPEKAFQERKQIAVTAGEVTEIASTYKTFDKESLKGDAVATVTLTRPDGSPAPNAKWKLTVRNPSLMRPVDVDSGTTNESGIATITGLKSGDDAPVYLLQSEGGEQIGQLEMTSAEVSTTMPLPPTVGDIAPDVTLVNMDTGEDVKLSDYRGQVLFLDFWATWCGPCQEPMQHNSDLLKKRGADWNGKAAILAISCDDELDTLKDHVTERGWDNVTQLWCKEGGTGWQATAMRTYAISGVPTAFLVDQEGKILWRGHPSSFPLEQRFDELIKKAESEVAASGN